VSTELRVAVIGTRFGGSVHVPGFQLVDSVQVVAVASEQLERARAVAAQTGVPHAFDDYRRMLDEVQVDLLSIATPVYLHHEMVLEAARRGIHVLCEKPLALSAEQVEEMLGAVTAGNLRHAVDFQFRYHRGVATLKRALDDGRLGEPRMARVVSTSDVRATAEKVPFTWWSERDKGGGVLAAVTSHWIDFLQWCFGAPRDITSQLNTFVPRRRDASGAWRRVETEDTAHLAMRLGSSGVQATIDVSMAVGPPGSRVELYGTEGALVLDGFDQVQFSTSSGAVAESLPLVPARFARQPDQALNISSFAALAADLRDAIGGDSHAPRLPDFGDGLAVQEVLDAACQQEAAREAYLRVGHGEAQPE
jgi:predicted dehydrogenase